ncbi:hypothetical protein ACEN2J_05515 [Pseudorhodobacter sp. W20_MBD10_FR17]|uniref:hypothetical protein n=1 Tax=Pseudorhodobacter sp. W20_MBD10_FR17 TaxID=3240266 RepID=UPI003F95E403
MIFRNLLAGVLCVMAGPALAAQLAYTCVLDVPASQAWVPAQVIVLTQQGSPDALVNDPIINHFLKTPQKARVVADNAKRITFVWALPNISKGAQQFTSKFEYRLSYIKANKQASIIAKPLGYSDNFTAFGTCRVDLVS